MNSTAMPNITGANASYAGLRLADFALGAGFGDGDGDRVFVDIQTEVEFNSFHGVVDCLYSHDESERIPRLERGRSCGSAHPGNQRYK